MNHSNHLTTNLVMNSVSVNQTLDVYSTDYELLLQRKQFEPVMPK